MAVWTEIEHGKAIALYEFLQENRQICDAHTVDFFTEDHWTGIVPDGWKETLLSPDINHESFLNPENMKQSPVKDFLCKAKLLKFPLKECINDDATVLVHTASPIDRFGMTEKKAHEVKRMATHVKNMADEIGLQQIIDIGSGKGYLSEYLAFVHGLTVYGIDSSDINRLGAVDRSRKVQKYFGKHKQVVPPETPPISVKIPSPKLPMDSANCGDFPNEFNGQFLTTLVEPEVITDTTISDSTCNGFFKPITHHIGQSDRITDVLKDDGCHGDDHSHPSILIGLHTCGDLAGTGLRQFIDNDTLRAVCIVGCCYHHITETGSNPGFPMSQLMKRSGVTLGRRVLMLACQSEGRFLSVTSGTALSSVFYRAVLQVIFRDEMKLFKTKEDELSLCVGRIKKYSSFVEYCRKAMRRLDIPLGRQPSDEVLIEFNERYFAEKLKVQRYLQIRAAIAPVIESLIVIDRLLYLQEQKGVKKAWLVQLFSSSLSPRCMGLCAYK